jgi:hypothetical protein
MAAGRPRAAALPTADLRAGDGRAVRGLIGAASGAGAACARPSRRRDRRRRDRAAGTTPSTLWREDAARGRGRGGAEPRAAAARTLGPTALVVQITVSGAFDVEQAVAVAEAIAAEPPAPDALADAVARIAAGAGVRVERSKLFADWKRNATRAALRVDLGLAQASATRWTAFAAPIA